jgi:tRNA (cytidine32/uridine32-2'-O)-methyltransferase
MLDNIKIVLINTSHPGNIGSAARAMKTMGLSELYLVGPLQFPHPKALELASGAVDILEKAVVVPELNDAIADCGLVVGTSARSRSIPWPMLSPREFGEKAIRESQNNKVAVLFGREQTGLTNEELHKCHFHIHIPSNPVYSSLNIASAVQVLAYELRVASQLDIVEEKWDYQWATGEEMEHFYVHLEKILIQIEFLKPEVPRQLMARLQRLFNRARPDELEVKMLRGILSAVERAAKLSKE